MSWVRFGSVPRLEYVCKGGVSRSTVELGDGLGMGKGWESCFSSRFDLFLIFF